MTEIKCQQTNANVRLGNLAERAFMRIIPLGAIFTRIVRFTTYNGEINRNCTLSKVWKYRFDFAKNCQGKAATEALWGEKGGGIHHPLQRQQCGVGTEFSGTNDQDGIKEEKIDR